jgi:hypothetical protein
MDGGFKPGSSGNPNGRPSGARNRGSYELRERLKARGGKDPAEFLSDLITNSDASTECKIQASGQLMPYYHSKLGATPIPPSPVYVQEAVSLPRPTNIQSAYENILKLSAMKAQGQLDFATADSLINDQRVVLNAMVDEAKLAAAHDDPNADRRIIITGGLPPIPGCDVIMPQLNGHKTIDQHGQLIGSDQQNPEPKPSIPGEGSLPCPEE